MEKLSESSNLNGEEVAKRFVVYELREPDTDAVRYVGSTTRPELRKVEHLTQTPTEKTRLARWVRVLQKRGLQPKFVEVEECADERAMLEAEATLISLYRAEFGKTLLNMFDPGTNLRSVHVTTCNGYVLHNGERWLIETIVNQASMDRTYASYLGSVCGYVCEPEEDEIFTRNGARWLNVYVPSKIEPMEGAHPIIDKLLLFLTNGDEKGVKYITHWLAKKVQNPGGRSMTALVFQGQQGTGKNMFASIVREMIGAENSVNIGQAALESNFNATFAEKLLVIADEVVTRDNMHKDITSSALKQYITDDPITVNQKYVPVRKVPNRMSLIFTSNAAVPVKIEGKDDRRYSVFQPQPADAGIQEHAHVLLQQRRVHRGVSADRGRRVHVRPTAT